MTTRFWAAYREYNGPGRNAYFMTGYASRDEALGHLFDVLAAGQRGGQIICALGVYEAASEDEAKRLAKRDYSRGVMLTSAEILELA